MDQEILKRLEEMEKKVDAIYETMKQAKRWIIWTVIVTAVLFILPLIGIAFVLPSYLNTLQSALSL